MGAVFAGKAGRECPAHARLERRRSRIERPGLSPVRFVRRRHQAAAKGGRTLNPKASIGMENRWRMLAPGGISAMISSTALDLPDHRKQVFEACLCEDIFPV